MCSPSLTGVSTSKAIENTGGKTTWGGVDFFDGYFDGENPIPEEIPICHPRVNGAAYVLCSEKDEKTLLICISQVTDNPVLAKKIFETFRWIK